MWSRLHCEHQTVAFDWEWRALTHGLSYVPRQLVESQKADTKGMLRLCLWQSRCSKAARKSPYSNRNSAWTAVYSALTPSALPWDIHQQLSSLPAMRHKRIASEPEESVLKPCYGLFRHWQWFYFGIQRWWRFQWWSSKDIRVSAQKTVICKYFGYCLCSMVSLKGMSNSTKNV